jgi:maltooligosyltrehalose trehalohydrolase
MDSFGESSNSKHTSGTKMKVGANFSKNQTEFVVWAPNQHQVSLVLPKEKQTLKMDKADNGYWKILVDKVKPETRYLYRLDDDKDRPDPASDFQPDGVFGPSAVVDHSSYLWNDKGWLGIKLENMIMYELHVGAFSRQGTFAAAKRRAKDLSKLGINAVELMPVAQFSGSRNWGYDAVLPFSVQNTYGGPEELKKLVDEFHANGIAVILDVVYNHLGPEGNFLPDFAPYFHADRTCPWGKAINFDAAHCHGVRNFFLENAVNWFQHYHIDGLRLDAVFTILDSSQKHFLNELSETTQKLSTKQRKLILIAENDSVDPKMVTPTESGGYGLDAVWHDNLHHSLHALLTGERCWYYGSFGTMKKLEDALLEENVTSLEDPKTLPGDMINPRKLVVFSQNHDQIGNRPLGERLITLAGFEAAKLAAGITILSQYTPLLFMGEEYGENTPFLFFTDFSNKTLGKRVRVGRKTELRKNGWTGEPMDPQAPKSFACSKINWAKRSRGKGKKILHYYEVLISLKKAFASSDPNKCLQTMSILSKDELLLSIQKENLESTMLIVANFSKQNNQYSFPGGEGSYVKILDSADAAFSGPGSTLPRIAKLEDKHVICPLSMAVFLNRKAKNDG